MALASRAWRSCAAKSPSATIFSAGIVALRRAKHSYDAHRRRARAPTRIARNDGSRRRIIAINRQRRRQRPAKHQSSRNRSAEYQSRRVGGALCRDAERASRFAARSSCGKYCAIAPVIRPSRLSRGDGGDEHNDLARKCWARDGASPMVMRRASCIAAANAEMKHEAMAASDSR